MTLAIAAKPKVQKTAFATGDPGVWTRRHLYICWSDSKTRRREIYAESFEAACREADRLLKSYEGDEVSVRYLKTIYTRNSR